MPSRFNDVERVFTAVTDLKRRDGLDITAFVEQWNCSLDAVTGPYGLPRSWAQDFRESLSGEHVCDHELQAAFEQGVLASRNLPLISRSRNLNSGC